MTRSLLRPLRTRRVICTVAAQQNDSSAEAPTMTPGTRKTLAAIGALWVTFATSASATPAPAFVPAGVTAPQADASGLRRSPPESLRYFKDVSAVAADRKLISR